MGTVDELDEHKDLYNPYYRDTSHQVTSNLTIYTIISGLILTESAHTKNTHLFQKRQSFSEGAWSQCHKGHERTYYYPIDEGHINQKYFT